MSPSPAIVAKAAKAVAEPTSLRAQANADGPGHAAGLGPGIPAAGSPPQKPQHFFDGQPPPGSAATGAQGEAKLPPAASQGGSGVGLTIAIAGLAAAGGLYYYYNSLQDEGGGPDAGADKLPPPPPQPPSDGSGPAEDELDKMHEHVSGAVDAHSGNGAPVEEHKNDMLPEDQAWPNIVPDAEPEAWQQHNHNLHIQHANSLLSGLWQSLLSGFIPSPLPFQWMLQLRHV